MKVSAFLSFACVATSESADASSDQRLKGDGTCHGDADYTTIYEELLGISDFEHESGKFVEEVLEKMQEEGRRTSSLLEVGPGPGQIARALGKTFTEISLVEPNEHFRERLGRRFSISGLPYKMFPGYFEDFSCRDEGYDLVVLSHMLYHVDQSKRAGYLDRAYNCLAEGGLLVVAMIHDGGEQYAFVQQFDTKDSSAREVREHFKTRKLMWESVVRPSTVIYNAPSVADNFENAYKLVYFLVSEDAMTRSSYLSMGVSESKVFEKKLRDYTWSLMDSGSGSFTLTMVDEYVFAKKGVGKKGAGKHEL